MTVRTASTLGDLSISEQAKATLPAGGPREAAEMWQTVEDYMRLNSCGVVEACKRTGVSYHHYTTAKRKMECSDSSERPSRLDRIIARRNDALKPRTSIRHTASAPPGWEEVNQTSADQTRPATRMMVALNGAIAAIEAAADEDRERIIAALAALYRR